MRQRFTFIKTNEVEEDFDEEERVELETVIENTDLEALEEKFENFLKSQDFVNKVGQIAETEGHHPDLWYGWGYARIKIFTHAIKGLAESDFILAAKIDIKRFLIWILPINLVFKL